MTLQTHADLLNLLIAEHGYQSYLEVGVQYAERNFDLIRCAEKDGVDICSCAKCNFHMSSEQFWDTPGRNYDLIFIDGDHRAFAALNDIVRAVERLNPGGTVVVDNINPETADDTRLYMDGTTWKAWAILRMSRPDLEMVAIDTRNSGLDSRFERGWGIIRKGSQELFLPQESKAGLPCYFGEHWDLTWEFLERHRAALLNLVSLDWFLRDRFPALSLPQATAQPTEDSSVTIPRSIHFVWIGPPMPDWAADNIRLFRELNPGFTIQTHGREVLLPFLEPAYRAIKGDHLYSRRSDILRVSALLRWGGWYFDTDFLPLRPLTELYRDQGNLPRGAYVAQGDTVSLANVFAENEPPTRQWIANGVIGAAADSAFLACVLRGLLMTHEDKQIGWDSYGPRLFTEVAERFPGSVHVGRMDDWFRLGDAETRRRAYNYIRKLGFKESAIRHELGDALPYAFHMDMQDRTELP